MLLHICLIYNANIHFISETTKLIWKYYNFIILFNLNNGRFQDILDLFVFKWYFGKRF